MPAAVIAPIQWLINLFLPILEFLHDSIGLGWGLSIIVLTCLLRLAVLPLGVKSFKSMRGLQAITPQMKALQTKYKDDKPRLQQETMKLYSEHKVNPFGSCLPLLVQIPFLISFYYMLRTDLKFEICGGGRDLNLPHDIGCHKVPNPSTEFTYNPDTFAQVTNAAKDRLGDFGESFLGITDITAVATGGLLALLLVLYVGSQMASSIVNMPPTADKNQKRLMLALPLVFVFFLIPIKPPSGLFIYWITTNVFTLVQQWGLIQVYGHVKHAPVPEDDDDDVTTSGGAAAVRSGGGGVALTKSGGGQAPPPPPRKRKKKRSGRRR